MKIDTTNSDNTILAELGQRVARLRLEQNLKQSELAQQAGVGLRTVQRLESGAVATQLSGFVRVCRVLGLLGQLDQLIPEAATSPIAQLKQQNKTRRRAFGKKPRNANARKTSPGKGPAWTWGKSS